MSAQRTLFSVSFFCLLSACDGGAISDTDAAMPDGAVPERDAGMPDPGVDAGSLPDEWAHLAASELTDEERAALDERVLSATVPAEHPRLFGTNERWLPRVRAFEELDPECTFEGESGWGTVKNARAAWWARVWGNDPCDGPLPSDPAEYPEVAFYLAPGDEGGVQRHIDRQLRAIFIIRRELACQAEGGDCIFAPADLERVIEAFVAYEMDRLRNAELNECGYVRAWHRTSQKFIDINSPVGFRFFNLMLDTLHDHPALSSEDRQLVSDRLGAEIDSYLCSLEGTDSSACGAVFDAPCSRPRWSGNDRDSLTGELNECFWNLCNGNNWTPLLNVSALYWWINFHDVDPRADRVLRGILATNWLHRRHMLDDGTYTEGSSYIGLSINPSLEMNQLMLGAFGEPLHSYRWGVLDRTGDWLVENVAPDGRQADFGDAWDRTGFSGAEPLESELWREVLEIEPLGSTALDACLVRRYFENSYYDHAFAHPWSMEPALARDWAAIAGQCADTAAGGLSIYPDQVEAISTVVVPGATVLAQQDRPLYQQADRVWLAIAGTPNEFPHRELDFGGVIWSAYGHRLLYDFGYGQIFHNDSMEYVHGGMNFVDHALGANTLVIEEAGTAVDSSYLGQFQRERGTIERLTVGGIDVVRLDGSQVYGASREDGWLEVMRRFTFALPGGVHAIVDAFRTRGGRALTVDEAFYTGASALSDCSAANEDVALELIDASTIELRPRCSELERITGGWAPAEAIARIVVASDAPGALRLGPAAFLEDDPDFAPFYDGDMISLVTRTATTIYKRPFVFAPSAPAERGVRVFLLVPGTATSGLPAASITAADCEGASCFDVSVEGETLRVTVDHATLDLALTPG
jgi:hypothetical protein